MQTRTKELIRNGDTDYATAFLSLEGSEFDILTDIVIGAVAKHKILHIWPQEGSIEDIACNGKIEKLEGTNYTICYWGQDKEYKQDGEDYKMQINELAVGFICGGVVFL